MFGVFLSRIIKSCADLRVAVSLTLYFVIGQVLRTGGDELLLASKTFLVTPHKIRQNGADFHLSILTLNKCVTKALALEQCDNVDLT